MRFIAVVVRKKVRIRKPLVSANKGLVVHLDQAPEDTDRAILRKLAKMTYITSQEFVSVARMQQGNPLFEHLPLSLLEKWFRLDHWVEERKAYLKRIEEALLKQLEEAHVKAEVDQLKELDLVAGILKNEITSGKVEAKSLEGLAGAWDKITRLRCEVRDKVRRELEPEVKEGTVVEPTLRIKSKPVDPSALRKAAIALIKASQQENSQIEEDDDETLD